MNFRFCRTLTMLMVALVSLSAISSAHADKEWGALPEETAFAIHVPAGKAFVEKIRKQTRFGQVVLSEQRIEKFIELLSEQDPEGMNEMQKQLAQFDLKGEDFLNMMNGSMGIAGIAEQAANPQDPPVIYTLIWTNPGAELATKMTKAMNKSLEKAKDEEDGPNIKRFDEKLGGFDVVHLMADRPEEIVDFSFENGEFKQIEKKFTSRTHSLYIQDGGRIMMAVLPAMAIDGDDADPNAEQKLEKLKGYLARFASGTSSGFARRMATTGGMAEAMPAGESLMEAYFDVPRIMKMAMASMDDQEKKIFEAFGIHTLGPMAMRMTMRDDQMWAGGFVSTPGPRTGLLTLFDQKALPATIPAWVPANAVGYGHLSFDLGGAFTLVKKIVSENMDPQAAGMIQMAEGGVMQVAGAPLANVLSSLGTKHAAVTFAPSQAQAAAAEGNEPQMSDRAAIVWELTDQAIWDRVLAWATQMIQGQPDAPAKIAEEQGFKGIRVEEGPTKVGMFIGQKHMVMAVGEGVSEQVLTSIRTPPAGEDAMRNAPHVQEANRILQPKPGLGYGVTDMDRYVQSLHNIFIAGFREGFIESGGPDDMLDKMIKAMPTAEEMKGTFGVSANQMLVNEHGLTYHMFMVMPAAK